MAILAKHFPSPFHRMLTAKLSPPFPCFTLLKLSFFSTSISPAAAAENPFAQLLRNEFGLCECEVSKIVRLRPSFFTSGSRSTQTAHQAIQFFRDSAFTEEQVRKIIVTNPSVLALKVEGQLKPKIERMKALGLTGKDLANAVCRGLLSWSLEKALIPRIEYLQTLFGYKVDLLEALRKGLWLLSSNIERIVKPNVELLQQSGVQGELLLFLISRCPNILAENPDSLKFKIEYVRKMGILQPSKTFANALMVLNRNGPETLEKKLKHLASLGFLEHEIKEMIRKYPTVLCISVEKTQKNMEFLIHIAGFPPNSVLSYASIITYSLESRIKPRHRVLKYITALQPSKRFPCFLSLLKIGEQKFLEKYVKSSTHATTLLDIYNGKAVDLDISKARLYKTRKSMNLFQDSVSFGVGLVFFIKKMYYIQKRIISQFGLESGTMWMLF